MIYDWKQKSLYDAIETLRIDGACDDSMLLDHILQWLSSDDLEECIYDFVVDNNLESDYIEGKAITNMKILNKKRVIKYLRYLRNKIDCENDSYVEYQLELKTLNDCIELLKRG